MQTAVQGFVRVCDFWNAVLWNSETWGWRGTRTDIIITGLHLTEGRSDYVMKVN